MCVCVYLLDCLNRERLPPGRFSGGGGVTPPPPRRPLLTACSCPRAGACCDGGEEEWPAARDSCPAAAGALQGSERAEERGALSFIRPAAPHAFSSKRRRRSEQDVKLRRRAITAPPNNGSRARVGGRGVLGRGARWSLAMEIAACSTTLCSCVLAWVDGRPPRWWSSVAGSCQA